MEKKREKTSSVVIRQKKVLKEMLANDGKLEPAVRKAGYSKNYARAGRFQKTKTWKDLLEEYLPDDELQKKHKQLLNQKTKLRFKGVEIGEVDETDVQAKALDMAYKLKGKYAPEKFQNVSPYEDMTLEELNEEIEKIERKLKKK